LYKRRKQKSHIAEGSDSEKTASVLHEQQTKNEQHMDVLTVNVRSTA